MLIFVALRTFGIELIMHLIANDGMAERDKTKQTQPYPVKAGIMYNKLSSALISSSNISTADTGLDSSRVLTSISPPSPLPRMYVGVFVHATKSLSNMYFISKKLER